MPMGMVQTAKNNPVITSVAAFFISTTAIVSGTQALGIRIIPWASAGDIERVEKAGEDRDEKIVKAIQGIQDEQKVMRQESNALLRDFWQKRLDEANEELRLNPSSRTAKKQKQEAEAALEKIDRQEAGSPHP